MYLVAAPLFLLALALRFGRGRILTVRLPLLGRRLLRLLGCHLGRLLLLLVLDRVRVERVEQLFDAQRRDDRDRVREAAALVAEREHLAVSVTTTTTTMTHGNAGGGLAGDSNDETKMLAP
jgi:hypothetical protein